MSPVEGTGGSNKPITAIHKDVPPHEPPPKAVGPSIIRLNLVRAAEWGVTNQKHFIYTQTAQRAQMYGTKPFTIPEGGLHTDCSQFYSALLHWCGVPGTNSTDYTGTLLQKGKLVAEPKPGDCVIWGGGTGEHAAMYVGDGFTIGFGHSPGAPNRVSLAAMSGWMSAHNHPGVRFLSFTP